MRWDPFARPEEALERWLIVATAAVATVLPFLAGGIAKLRLDAHGAPTLPWINGFVLVAFVVPVVAVGWLLFALPLRFLWQRVGTGRRLRLAVACGWAAGLLGGAVTTGRMLLGLFAGEAIYAVTVALLVPWGYWKYTLAGCALGFVPGFAVGWGWACWRGRPDAAAGTHSDRFEE